MFEEILNKLDDIVWGIPTIALILVTGLVVTIAARGIQFSKLGRAFKSIFKKNEGAGELSGFAALCTALSATIGTGNIVGVATAIAAGGPGALFWMWLAAILGTATKYAECMLAIKYREVKADGSVLGGPFYTIEKGMGPKWKWLAVAFAIFGALAGLMGIGTMTQINGITSAANTAFDPESAHIAFSFLGNDYTWATVVSGIIVTLCVALVVLGGLKRISKVAEKVVPAMAVIYVFLGLSIVIMNATKIPAAFSLIFKGAFGFQAIAGGAAGFVMKQVTDAMQKGIARGIFSNEAGLGSAPIAAAPVKTDEPVEQGLVNMTGTVIDTLIICTMTGLAIVIGGMNDGLWANNLGPNGEALKGVALTAASFNKVLGGDGHSVQFLLMLCLAFFAFTTILGWDYYSEKCLEYLSGGKMGIVKGFRWLYILAVAIGPYFTVNAVFTIADIFNGLMAIPNCISLIVLAGVVAKETKAYFTKFPKMN
ncbi:MAG: sodium:alanine symporter family protein [Treponema sp.]|nr:sodium:alanine symporter family protein [Treponema sp.]